MTEEKTSPAAAVDIVVKSSPDSKGAVTDAGAEQSGEEAVETAEAKAVVAAPSEVVKHDDVADPGAGNDADGNGTEESAPPADKTAPVPEQASPIKAEPEPVATPAPAPEPASEEAHNAGPAPTPSEEAAPASSTAQPAAEPEVSQPAAEQAPAAAAVATPFAADGAAPEEPMPKLDAQELPSGEPAVNGTSSVGAAEEAPSVQRGTVQEISKRLSGASLQSSQPATPSKPTTAEKQQASVPVAAAAVLGARAPSRSPSGVQRSGEASPISTHDTKNTINVSQLLKLGAFKMQPLKDFVPYADLQRLRVEDGIDATRKEDYLGDEDFKEVFGMDRDAFKKQPAWRQAQAKKKANLY